MKIAIHNNPGSFSDYWIAYCKENSIPYKIVNCYNNDIIEQLRECDALMWHWSHEDYKAGLFAKQLIFSLRETNIKVFPDVDTGWHFDDKVGQKYLLESIQAPLVKSYVFYSRKEANEWIAQASFPKVFKLRGGAGSINVHLVKTPKKARALVRKAFGKGFSSVNLASGLRDRLWVFRRDKSINALKGVLKGMGRYLIPTEFAKLSPRQKGYILFQDFIPSNSYDTRLVIIGDRCVGVRRYIRKGDFRASGSGLSSSEPQLIDSRSIKIAFEIARKLNAQCLAMDFIMDGQEPKLVEMSYAFPAKKSDDGWTGYWDSELNWHEERINLANCMIEDLLKNIDKEN